MFQVEDVKLQPVVEARPAAAPAPLPKTGARLGYIDTVRLVLTILVIMVHAAITYGSAGSWMYTDPAPDDETTVILLSLFLLVCQSFFMALFFFFAGYFTPASYDRKNTLRFWKDRLLRLGIPLLAYTFFFGRIPNYIDAVANGGVRLSFWQYMLQTFWGEADAGPTWFLFALLGFSVGYTLWRLASRWIRLDLSWTGRLPVPGTKTLLGLAMLIAAGMFAVSQFSPIVEPVEAFETITLMVAFFPGYILLFTAGILAYRNDWLARLPGKTLRFWSWLSAALVVILPLYLILGGATEENTFDLFMGGFNLRCVGMSLWFGLACISLSMTLTLWLRDRKKPDERIARYAGSRNYTVYLIHPLVLVPLTFGMSFIALHPLMKFGLASLATVAVCYLLAGALRRIPGATKIF